MSVPVSGVVVAGILPADAFNIVSLIAVFVLISLGLHFTFGMLNIVNLAHGEFILIGAYTAFELQESTGSVVLGMVAAPFVTALVGIAVERGILRFLYDRPLDTLIATFGIALVIRQIVQLIYTANPRTVTDPIGRSFVLAGMTVPLWRMTLVLASIVLVVLVALLLDRTTFGLHARATVRNPTLAETMGIRTASMRTRLFAIGSGLAGIAGALIAPIATLNPSFGTLFLVNSFLVVILGGQGSLTGLVAAAAVLGGSLAILQFWISTVYAQIIVLIIAIVGVRLRVSSSGRGGGWKPIRRAGRRGGG